MLLSVTMIAASDASASETLPAQFTETTKTLDLLPYFEILVDSERSLSIEDVTKPSLSSAFSPATRIGNSFGFSGAAYWVRFSVHLDRSLQDTVLLQLEFPLVDHVTLYKPDGSGGFYPSTTGDRLPFSSREVSFRNYLFRLPEHRGMTQTYYMRLQTEGSMQIPISLWSSLAIAEQIDHSNLILGAYYGTILLLIVISIPLYFKMRDRLFLYYMAHLCSYVLLQFSLNGFSYQFLWPDSPWFSSRVISALIGLVIIAAILFSGRFLQIQHDNHPYLKRFFTVLLTFSIVCFLLSLFGDYAIAVKLSTFAGALLPLFALTGGIITLRAGHKPARYFIAAWCVFLTGIWVGSMVYFGLLPNNVFTLYSMQIGSSLGVMLLGYALLTRIDRLRVEKEKATNEAREYLNQLNSGLEILVDKRTAQLREREEHLRAVFEAIPDLIWMKDKAGVYMSCNSKFERFYGAKQSEIVGKTDFDFVDRTLATFFRGHDKTVIDTGEPSVNEEEVVFADDGHHEILETVKTPMFNADGELIGVLGIGRDITERRQAEQALLASQKMEAMGQLTGGIAHDFNNILGIILGNIELLEHQSGLDEKTVRRLAAIKKSSQRAADLTKQLLGFTRHSNDLQVVTDINLVITEMDNLIARSVTPEVEVKQELAEDLWLTEIDPGDFQDVLINLVINARDAMPDGGQLLIQTRNSVLDSEDCAAHQDMTPGEYVVLLISDSGIGIDELHQKKIFEPFFTTKEQGKGTGLGLAMVFGFIRRSGGCIRVDSETGQGTTFSIFLPRVQADAVLPLDRNGDPDETGRVPRGSETILVVDDEEELLLLAKDILSAAGYRVLTALNGEQALVQLKENAEIALLMSDVVMPGGMTGFELIDEALRRYPSLKVLLSSGHISKTLSQGSALRDHVNLLKKPYTPLKLARWVRAALDDIDLTVNNE